MRRVRRPSAPRTSARASSRNGAASARGKGRWRQILDAAAAMFLEKGYAGTSIQDVGDAVGLLKGSLYHYIDSKEDLLFHVLADLHAGAMRHVDEVEASRAPPLERLQVFLERLVTYIAERAVQSAIFFRDFNVLPRARQRRIIRERDVYLRVIRGLIEAAQRRGEVPSSVDAHLAGLTLIGAISWVFVWYRTHGQYTPAEIGRQQARLLIAGLRDAAAGADAAAAPRAPRRRRVVR